MRSTSLDTRIPPDVSQGIEINVQDFELIEQTFDSIINKLMKAAYKHEFKLIKDWYKNAKRDRFTLKCTFFGRYDSKAKVRMKTSTIRTGCPFRVNIYKQSNGYWKSKISNPIHIGHGRELVKIPLTEDEKKTLRNTHSSGGMPRHQMVDLLNNYPCRGLKMRDIHNENFKAKGDFYNDRSTMQVLMDICTKKGYSVLFKFNSSNQLTHATFVSPYSLKLSQTNSFVLLFDCTYKTNRYKLPLLH